MAVILDRLVNIGLAKESSRGTAVTPTFWVPQQEFSVQDKVEKAVDNSAIGRIEEAFDAEVTSIWAEGALSGNIYMGSIGLLLLATLGTVSTADNADSDAAVKDHTFTVGNTTAHPSLTISAKDSNEALAYALAMVSSLELTAERNQFVRYNAQFMSKSSASASLTPSFSADNRFRAQDVVVKIADDTASLSGASAIKLRSATITINKNTDTEFVLGNIAPDDIYNKQFGVTVKLETLYRDSSWVTLLRAGTKKAMSIAFTNSAATIGSAAHPSLTFTFQPGHFTARDLAGGLDDLETESVEMQGLFSLANAAELSAVLTNTTASY